MSGAPKTDAKKTEKRQRPPKKPVVVRVFRALKRRYRARKRHKQESQESNESMMARWTRNVGIFTVALSGVGLLNIAVIWQQYREMQIEQRPWIYTDAPVLNANIHRNMVGTYEANLIFNLHNVGHLPGFYAQISFKAPLPNGMHVGNIQTIQREACKPGLPIPANLDGDTVFPGQIIGENLRTGINISGWRPDDGVLIWIIGCVVYQFPSNTEQHFSRFVYQIRLRNPPPLPMRLPKFPDELTPQQIEIVPWPDKDAFVAD